MRMGAQVAAYQDAHYNVTDDTKHPFHSSVPRMNS
jgi:hypothetical protein